jgi:hypothetical protein
MTMNATARTNATIPESNLNKFFITIPFLHPGCFLFLNNMINAPTPWQISRGNPGHLLDTHSI